VASTHYHDTGRTPARRTLWRRYAARLVKVVDEVHVASTYETRLVEEHLAAIVKSLRHVGYKPKLEVYDEDLDFLFEKISQMYKS